MSIPNEDLYDFDDEETLLEIDEEYWASLLDDQGAADAGGER